MNATLGSFTCGPLGTFSVVEIQSEESNPSTNGPIHVLQVLDTSGSMGPNQESLIATACASIDAMPNYSTIQVITFNEFVKELIPATVLTDENRANLKTKLQSGLSCFGGTNIEAALHYLSHNAVIVGRTHVLFISDGMANQGLCVSSTSLLKVAKRLPQFDSFVFHTLGLQLVKSEGLNAEFLETLALDTNGIFKIGTSRETIAPFVGDLLASHATELMTKVHISVLNADDMYAKLISKLPTTGYVLHSDRSIRVVYEWPSSSFVEPIKLQIKAKQLDASEYTRNIIPINTALDPKKDQDRIVSICKVLMANALEKKVSLEPVVRYFETLESEIPELISLRLKLEEAKEAAALDESVGGRTVLSRTRFEMLNVSNIDTPVAQRYRQQTEELSQQYYSRSQFSHTQDPT
jgi:hypothetical protein